VDLADDLEKEIKKASDEAINYAVESLIADHVEAEKSMLALRDALSILASDQPIILFIDELD
jgi:hypothetical protein